VAVELGQDLGAVAEGLHAAAGEDQDTVERGEQLRLVGYHDGRAVACLHAALDSASAASPSASRSELVSASSPSRCASGE
jgi:hypothetical protein